MGFDVVTTPDAERDATEILDWLMEQHAGETGLRWFLKLDEAIHSLSEMPKRCKVAPESDLFLFDVRELHYGRPPHVYRILFTVEESEVYVLHIRHGRRLPLARAR